MSAEGHRFSHRSFVSDPRAVAYHTLKITATFLSGNLNRSRVCAFFSINPQSSRSERIHSKCQPLSERALRKQNLALASCRSSRRSGCCSTLLTALHYFRHLPPAERKRLAPRLLLCIENKKICSDHTTQ
ncbi:uncharacterized [Tachysurus ichikawai]